VAYTTITYGDLKDQLASRLGDPNKVFFLDAELGLYLIDALRTFNALTGFWRQRAEFPSVANQIFYDLRTVAPGFCDYTVTDRDAITFMEYQLIEPPTPTVWTGSEMFTLDSLAKALQRRRDQYLLDTGMVITANPLFAASGPPATRTTFNDKIIDLRRVVFQEQASGRRSALLRDDVVGFNAFKVNWQGASTLVPVSYSTGAVPPLTVMIAPEPQVTGFFDVLSVNSGDALDPAVVASTLGVPDDWTWPLRFGALADLLAQDGPGRDVPRAQYAQQRYMEGVQLGTGLPALQNVTVNGMGIQLMGVLEADEFSRGWDARRGRPLFGLTMGTNIMALSPVANQVYGLAIDVIRKAPVPTDDADPVEVSREVLDGLLDYGQHLALFKTGGADFARSGDLLDRFYRVCGVDLDHLRAAIPNLDVLTDRSKRDGQQTSRSETAAGVVS
jgi:hypothetical protein